MNADAADLRGLDRPAFAILVLFLLTLILTYPVVFHLSDRLIGGGGDAWQFPWNNFVFRQQVLHWQDPYYTDYIFYPVGTSLLLHSYTEWDGLVGLLLSPFCNEVAQTNIAMLLATFLSGLGAYLLARHVSSHNLGSLFAGIAFAFSPFRMLTMSGHLNFALTQWLPLGLWSFLRLAEKTEWRECFVLALFVACCYYSNQYYAVYLLIAFLVMLIYGLLFLPSWRNLKLFGRLALAAVICLVLLTPAVLRFWRDYHSGDLRTAESRLPEAERNAASASGYLSSVKSAENKQSPGWIVLLMAVAGTYHGMRFERRKTGMLLLLGIVFFLLSLGPSAGNVPLPYLLLMKAPFLHNLRIPWRFSILVLLALAVFAAAGIAFVSTRISGRFTRTVTPVLLIVLVLELMQLPVGMRGFSIPSAFYTISSKVQSGTMLALPFRPQYSFDSLQISHQIFHKQKLLTGRISRAPGAQIQYFRQIPIARAFHALSTADAPKVNPEKDRNAANFFRSFFRVRSLTLYPAYSRRRIVTNYVQTVFPDAKLLQDQKGFVIYELPEQSDKELNAEARNEEIRFFLYSGWEVKNRRTKVASRGKTAKLLLPDLNGMDLDLELEVRGRGGLTLMLDKRPLKEFSLKPKFQVVRASIDARSLASNHHLVTLQSSRIILLRSVRVTSRTQPASSKAALFQ